MEINKIKEICENKLISEISEISEVSNNRKASETVKIAKMCKISEINDKEKWEKILKIQTAMLFAIHEYMLKNGILQVMPVILSPITDPLSHSVSDASISYNGQLLQLTRSMIFHKQLTLALTGVKGIYIISPNVRLETDDKELSGRHLLEFSQLDIELREASQDVFMDFMEKLIIYIFKYVKVECADELAFFGTKISIPSQPFPNFTRKEIEFKLGSSFEQILSELADSPFWITDYEREFYDREDPQHPGHYFNYDLFYPEGYNEALSGGERDYEYEVLLRKICSRRQNPKTFESYLSYARKRKLIPSAGGGLGIERLLRFLTKQKHIASVSLFPKVPGRSIVF